MPAKPEKEIPEIKKQYFIALVPNSGIMNSVHALKTEIRDRFGAAHALKSPAHITLQMPFHKLESEEPRLITCLREFASREMPFHVTLDGFSAPGALCENTGSSPAAGTTSPAKSAFDLRIGIPVAFQKKGFSPPYDHSNPGFKRSRF